MKKLIVQGAGSQGGASLSALRGLICASAQQQLLQRAAASSAAHSRSLAIVLLTLAKWLLPIAALVSVPLSRHALISADLSLLLLSAAAIYLTVCFTVQDWREEGRVC